MISFLTVLAKKEKPWDLPRPEALPAFSSGEPLWLGSCILRKWGTWVTRAVVGVGGESKLQVLNNQGEAMDACHVSIFQLESPDPHPDPLL